MDVTLACEDANSKLVEVVTVAVVEVVTVADIYIMMQCLCVTKNEHCPLSS